MTALPKLRGMALPIAVGLGLINWSPELAAVPDASIKKTGNEWGEEPAEWSQKCLTLLIRCCCSWGQKTVRLPTPSLISQQETLILERLELPDLRGLSAFTQVT